MSYLMRIAHRRPKATAPAPQVHSATLRNPSCITASQRTPSRNNQCMTGSVFRVETSYTEAHGINNVRASQIGGLNG